jgi:hypothetical protein
MSLRSAADVCREIRDVEAARAELVALLSGPSGLSDAERADLLAVLDESAQHLAALDLEAAAAA